MTTEVRNYSENVRGTSFPAMHAAVFPTGLHFARSPSAPRGAAPFLVTAIQSGRRPGLAVDPTRRVTSQNPLLEIRRSVLR
jgi:hypothetical protein